MSLPNQLALHTWTLDTTPLPQVLEIARSTGWDAVELRRIDFERAAAEGQSEEQVLDLVRQSGLPVAAVGVTFGWMLAEGDARNQLLDTFERSCASAAALASKIVMSPVDRETGDPARAANSIREVGDIAARYGVRLALEFNSQVKQFGTLESVREVLKLAGHPACGLLLDTYHLERTDRFARDFDDLAPDEIVYIQYSDVPREGVQPGYALDRLPPGEGRIDFEIVRKLISEKSYSGPLSFEGPNPATWARDPRDAAQAALQASRVAFGSPTRQPV